MKKKNLFLIALLCAYSTLASAYTVTDNGDGSVTIDGGQWVNTTVTDNHGDTHTEVSGAPGAGLPNDFTTAEATLITGATKLIFKGYIDNMLAFQHDYAATSVDMSEAHFKQDLSSVEEVTYNKYDPVTKTTSSVTKIYMKNVMAFYYFDELTEAKLSKYVESICFKTIDDNSDLTTTFEIPESVKYIATQAIINTPIKSIVIPDNVEFINTQAFQNAAIKALIDVTVEGCTAAANGAFDKMATVGQTDADYAAYATLHFPEEMDDYFVNKNHTLSQATSLNKGKFQAWLDRHHSVAGNGWQEFINSGSGTPIIPTSSVVLRTYSDKKAHIVPLNFRAYLVNEITETDGKYYLHLQEVFAIPKNTGVILYGYVEPDANNRLSYTLPDLTGGGWDSTDPNEEIKPYTRNTGLINDEEGTPVNCRNFLEPSTTTVHENGVTVNGPYDTNDAKTKVIERNFIMGNFWDTTLNSGDNQIAAEDRDSKDYVGFFRVLTGGTLGANKAYLKLPSPDNTTYSASTGEVLFNNPTGMEVIVTNNGRFRNTYWHNPVSSGNWGQRPSTLPTLVKSIGEPGEEEYFLSVNSLENIMEDNGAIYTLQGVKVTNPQKGIYIKNGKKFIIK